MTSNAISLLIEQIFVEIPLCDRHCAYLLDPEVFIFNSLIVINSLRSSPKWDQSSRERKDMVKRKVSM